MKYIVNQIDNLIVDGLIAESYGRKYAKKVGYLYSEKVGGFVRVYKNNNRIEYIQ